MICIFCLQDKPPSDEHVFPDSIGGSLRINAVCRDCNSRLSRLVDNPFASCPVIQFARHAHSLGGKRDQVPFPLGATGTFADGKKVSLNRQFQPHVKRTLEITIPSAEKMEVHFGADASDRAEFESMLGTPLRKAVRAAFPNWTEEKLEAEIAKIVAAAKAKQATSISEPIRQKLKIDFDDLLFEFLKIAYEMWFRTFGYPWVQTSATAAVLRNALTSRDATLPFRAALGSPEIPLIGPSDRYHYAVQMGGAAHMRIFSVTCCVECESNDAAFQIPEDGTRVARLDFKAGSFFESSLADHLAALTSP